MILTLITIFRKIRVNVTQLQLNLGYAGRGRRAAIFNITNDGKMVRLDIYTDCHFIQTLLHTFRECNHTGDWAETESCELGSGLELLKNIHEDFTIDLSRRRPLLGPSLG